MLYAKLQRKIRLGKSLSTKTVALHKANVRFVGCRAASGLEFEGEEVGFVDFAEAEGVGGEAFTSFDFDEVFAGLPATVEGESDGFVCYFIPFGKNGRVRKFHSAINYAIEIYFGNIILLYPIGTIPCSRIGLPQLIPGIYILKV